MGNVLELDVQENIWLKREKERGGCRKLLTHFTLYYQGHPINIGQAGSCSKLRRKEKRKFSVKFQTENKK